MFICAFITQAKTKEEARHPRTESRLLENMTKDPISEFFLNQKNPDICSGAAGYISSEEIFSFSNDNDSRSFNFLFQIARGSGATLSECTFSSKERTSLKRLLQDRTTSRLHVERTRPAWFARQAGETRRLPSSTIKCSRACRCGTHKVPQRSDYGPWALAWPTDRS